MPRIAKPKPTLRRKARRAARPTHVAKSKPIELYEHKLKERVNNPPVGLVTSETDAYAGKKTYAYDPHLVPQLVWAGKAEHVSFEVPIVSLHVHERIDPRTIIEAVRRRAVEPESALQQLSLFAAPGENPPLREAVEFYKHNHGWSNRLMAGDSLLVMNSLIDKEGLAGQAQMIYIDPPYGIKYFSNFQPFVNKRDVKDGKDEDLSQEPEMVKAFRDTWELGIHSYLTYLRDRLLLARELLHESGSVFVQISDENLHLVRNILDEVFGADNFVSLVTVRKTGAVSSPEARLKTLGAFGDYLLWYARNKPSIKYRQLFLSKLDGEKVFEQYNLVFTEGGEPRRLKREELLALNVEQLKSVFESTSMESNGYAEAFHFVVEYGRRKYKPAPTRHWSTTQTGIERLIEQSRIIATDNKLRYVRYFGDFPVIPVSNIWTDIMGASELIYVVQTNTKIVERCMLMTTDPGDLVLDPTCGSGTTAYVAEQWGRRWITCDTSRVAITLAKQRLMTALFDYYELAQPDEGVDSGFNYRTVRHITLKSIANNEPAPEETLYDQPLKDNLRTRVSGPFTVEAVPAASVKPISEIVTKPVGDASIARSGETLRQAEWRDELHRSGIRGKGGQKIEFTRVEPLPGTRWLHADAETRESSPRRVVVSFGSEFAPLEQRQVELAIEEAQTLVPKPKLVVFAGFQFDPEAAKDIDETDWPGVTLLKAQMNADLFTEDLKKKRASNDSFWLIGQPDVTLEVIKTGEHKGKYRVEVHGFDYYNTRTGAIESGGSDKIAMWMLDPDYDGRSLFPRQVFFPMAGENDGWAKLARNLKVEIDEDLIEQYHGTVSLPFVPGDHQRVAVKIVDDRGIESLKIIEAD